ncbi:MAG: 2-dehydropantoate 2-reductase [Pseudomonadota bacterium]|jgi:2-dehydropantoate 2-reductase|nr:2-dehydropantoate 2-reductase [Pseudomonadota bacterium]MEC8173827.1 2-dehydropantoate 2-reductase [Pseudomonadota bacterium]MED6308783.1 2-dehydropantoate 2-reductase [Pseudomonadota bacterium]
MKFAILGAGAVGGYFGARLAEAGEDVTFMARGAHLEAIRSTGLRIESENGEAHIHPAQASDDPAEVGPVDYVLFAVKLFQTEETAGFAKPLVGPNTTLVALQNGVECANVLSAVHGKEKVLNGTSYIAAVIAEPGLIRQTGTFASFAFGEQDGTMSDRGQRLKEAADKAGLNPTYSSNVESLVWMKFLLIATMSSITTSTRKPIGELRDDPDIQPVIVASLEESIAVGRAMGVDLPENAMEQQLKRIAEFPAAMVASMYHDLHANKPTELEWMSGAVRRFGKQCGIPTPTHDAFYAILKPYRDGA